MVLKLSMNGSCTLKLHYQAIFMVPTLSMNESHTLKFGIKTKMQLMQLSRIFIHLSKALCTLASSIINEDCKFHQW